MLKTSKTFAFSIPVRQLTGCICMILTERKYNNACKIMSKVMFVKGRRIEFECGILVRQG